VKNRRKNSNHCWVNASATPLREGQNQARRAMRHILDDVRRPASGDLTREVHTELNGLPGEVQRAPSQLSVNLRTVIGDIHTETENLRGAAAEIASGNPHLSTRIEARAGSQQQTATSAVQGSQLAEDASGIARYSTRL